VDAPETGHLRGVVTLRELLISPDDRRLDSVMRPYLVPRYA
jgi:Mg/Co/Ni transporter MgtE